MAEKQFLLIYVKSMRMNSAETGPSPKTLI
jgi:hypothetical protein